MSSNTNHLDRTEWVDYAKGIGIILVVYGHVARGLFNAGISMPVELYKLADSIIYSFHMPLFFFLSGLFFYRSFSRMGAVGLSLNKIDTVVYPYLLWSILQGSIEAMLARYTNGAVTLQEVFSLWEPRAQFWFLYVLFFLFLLAGTLYSLISNRLAGLVFLASCVLYLSGAAANANKMIALIANCFIFFSLGIAFTTHRGIRLCKSAYSLPLMTALFVISQYVFHGYLGKVYTDRGFESLLLAFVSILFIVSLSHTLTRAPNRLLPYIGTSSMAIYLMHILTGSGVRIVLGKFMGIHSTSLHLIIGCIAGIALPLFALEIIRKFNIPYLFSAPISHIFKKPLT